MVDILALAISHGLLLLAAWRLLARPDLDADGAQAEPTRKQRRVGTQMRAPAPADAEDRPAGDRNADA
jgi:hypothetical protein